MWARWFYPAVSTDRLSRARGSLVTITCLGMIGAVVFIVGYWVVSGSLEDWETLVAAAVLSLMLIGIAWLSRAGRVRLAGWLLVVLLMLILMADVADYGVGSPTVAAFVIPLVLAACVLGFWAGMVVTVLSTASTWAVGWAQVNGWGWFAGESADISLLTFNAPAMTVIFVLIALMVGWWGELITSER